MERTEKIHSPIMALDRAKGLTDGVLAIVVTILVLTFEVPEHEFSSEGLLSFLAKLRISLLAYVVSFGIVATYWVQHTAIFHYVRVGNRLFTWLNLLFLVPVTILPFFTELRVEYHDEYRVTILYAGANVLSGLLLLAMWRYAAKAGLLRRMAPGVDRSMSGRILLGVGINLLGAAVAPISPHLSSVAFLALPLIYLSHRVVDSHWAEGGAG
jgi:uncharacterized membrane protein